MEKYKFIDLFSGIGGFHQAMEQLGGECVFASEIDKFCNAQYERNYRMKFYVPDFLARRSARQANRPGSKIKPEVLCFSKL